MHISESNVNRILTSFDNFTADMTGQQKAIFAISIPACLTFCYVYTVKKLTDHNYSLKGKQHQLLAPNASISA